MFSEEQLAQLSAPLEESRVSHRQGMSYLEAWDCIAKANDIFGHTNWSYTVERLERETFGWLAVVRLKVGDVVREDVGYTDYAPLDNDPRQRDRSGHRYGDEGGRVGWAQTVPQDFRPAVWEHVIRQRSRPRRRGAQAAVRRTMRWTTARSVVAARRPVSPSVSSANRASAKESTATTGARPKLALCKIHDRALLKTGSHSRLAHPQDGKWCFGETAIDIPEGAW